MARLVGYTAKDDNHYCTFGNEYHSDENLTNINDIDAHRNKNDKFKLVKSARVKSLNRRSIKRQKKQLCIFCKCSCCWKFCFKLCPCCCCKNCLCTCDNISDNTSEYQLKNKNIAKQPQQRQEIKSFSSYSKNPTLCIEEVNGTKLWSWDASIRSTSDKYLDTLLDDNSYDSTFHPNNKFRRPTIRGILEEAHGAEVGSSTSNRNNAAGSTSPMESRGSASSDILPSQSDEDIETLVGKIHLTPGFPSLGQCRSESMASVYSGAGDGRYGTVAVKGQVEFGMQYNYKQGALEIHVVKCKDLAAVDVKRTRSDPYVKVYLLPDKSKTGKRKTKVKKHTLNPTFNEILKFHMSLSNLESRTLWLTVWHSDMFGRNDFLGEVRIALQGKVFDNPQPQWYPLQERSEPFDDFPVYKGDIIVGLKFVPPEAGSHSSAGSNLSLRRFSKSSSSGRSSSSKGTLQVLVKEAKNLTAVKANGNCDAFCKSYLLPDKNRSSKQKTPVVKRSINPSWNYTFVYDDVSLEELGERALELTIWDHDRLASNEFLGGVRFSSGSNKYCGKTVDWMDATGKELSLWQSMLNRPNFWVEGCLALRSSLDNVKVDS